MKHNRSSKQGFNGSKLLWIASLAAAMSGCTGQVPGSFLLAQQDQNFAANVKINTKIDLLWVVDDSSSMESEQDKLRQGFAGFAKKYLQPTWDIQVAVITTDTYLANPAFHDYLNSTIAGTTGYQSPYVNGRLATWVNPSFNPTLVNTSTGAFDNGVKYNDIVPAWGPDYGLLLPNLHDGPIAGFCFEGLPYSLDTAADCAKRDDQTAYNGTSHCLNPDASAGETAENMCQNTIENDTVHSGKAILRTMPPTPLSGADLTAWTNQLIDDFKVNATTGINGMGSERGLGSVLEMIQDNEAAASTTKFFRPGSLRGIIFVTDEDDQTMTIPSGVTNVKPWDHYMCDQSSLVDMNGSGPITGTNGYCCDTPGNNCSFGANGLSCPTKVIDGTNLVVSLCPDPSQLMPVSDVKTRLDDFFSSLDGTTGNPNYFIATITPLSMTSINTLQALHDTDDQAAGAVKNKAVDRGDRYLDLGDLVGNGSLSMDISASDYSPLLDQIGQEILLKKSTFPLSRIPTGQEDMIVTLIHGDGTSMEIQPSQYTISGSNIIITDQNLVLSFTESDQITVTYVPKYVNK